MPTFIDFFAGAGGLSEGFIKAGYVPVAHVEMKKDACDTLRTRAAFHYLREHNQLDIYENYLRNKREGTDGSELWRQVPADVTNRVIQATIGDKTMKSIKEQLDRLAGGQPVDIIIGGPPCQAYSIAGRARLGKSVKEDPRNYLYKYYLRFIRHFKPRMFVFENVVGIKTAKTSDDIKPFEDLRRLALRFGYDIGFSEQVASDFEVLQHRHRMIIVGWRRLDADRQPTGLHYPDFQKISNPYHTRESVFSDLPVRISNDGSLCELVHYTRPLEEMRYLRETGIRGTFDFTTQHVTRKQNVSDREVYCLAVQALQRGVRLNYNQLPERLKTHKNRKSFLNRFFVVNPDDCCHTVVAHIAMDGHYYIYPNEHPTIENSRSISVREAARLQSFPDDYFFEGSRTSAFMQIGNAVPVMMAYHIALAILPQLQDE